MAKKISKLVSSIRAPYPVMLRLVHMSGLLKQVNTSEEQVSGLWGDKATGQQTCSSGVSHHNIIVIRGRDSIWILSSNVTLK